MSSNTALTKIEGAVIAECSSSRSLFTALTNLLRYRKQHMGSCHLCESGKIRKSKKSNRRSGKN